MDATDVRRLERRREDRLVAGVCGGVADHFGVDVTLVRVATVLLTIFGGAGVLLYAVGWAMIPEQGDDRSIADGLMRRGRWQPIAGIVLIVIAITSVGDRFWHVGDVGFPLFLIALGAFLLWFRPPDPAPAGVEPPRAEPPASAPLLPSPPQTGRDLRREARREHRDHRRQRRSLLPPVLGLLAIGGGIVGLAVAGGAEVRPAPVLAGGLIIVGLGLVAATWYGRGGGLVPLGLILLVALAVASAAHLRLEGGIGHRAFRPASAAELRDEYRLAIGELELDLGDVRPGAGQVEQLDASVGIGHLLIEVPRDVTVVLRGHAGAGNVQVDGDEHGGWSVDRDEVLHRGSEGGGRIEIDAEVGFGMVEVRDA